MTASKWKYEVVNVKPSVWSPAKHRERLKQTLDDMGLKGWELVGLPPVVSAFAELTLIFKRPA
jgi:hypothetical protein